MNSADPGHLVVTRHEPRRCPVFWGFRQTRLSQVGGCGALWDRSVADGEPVTALNRARQRRTPAATRPSPRKGNVRRSVAGAVAAAAHGVESKVPAPRRFERLRGYLARRERAPQTEAHEQQLRMWPRRLARRSLELGAVVGVAWGLLLAGREVYDYATTSARFEVQHIIYAPTEHVDDDSLRELLAVEPGTNILACDLEQLSERIAKHPWVALVTITRNLPDTLEIEVTEHDAMALVLAGRFYLVNDDGRAFKPVERGERGELPIITGIDRSALAAAPDKPVPQLVEALELVRLYDAKQRPRLGELHVGEDGAVTLYTAESGTALHLGREQFGERLERWDALRAALGSRADELVVVHLDHETKPDRRDRVVARFANDGDDALLLAQATASVDEANGEQAPASEAAQANKPPAARRAGRRNRIPTYE
jgi:cell division protein FtsQ